MKIGVSSYSFRRYVQSSGASMVDLCRKAKEFGFDAIEFTKLDGEDPVGQAKQIRSVCLELGLEISAYAVGANLMTDDREGQVRELLTCVDVAAALGAPLMRHDVCYSLPENTTWEDAIPVMVPTIRRVTDYARERGIRTCSENHGFVFQDSLRVKTLIDAVNDDNYRWLVDIGNFLCVDENPLDAVAVAAPYAIHVHAKDFIFRAPQRFNPEGFITTRDGNFIRGTILGHGVVPVADCIGELRKAGYDNTVSLEFEGLEDNLTAVGMGYRALSAIVHSTERS